MIRAITFSLLIFFSSLNILIFAVGYSNIGLHIIYRCSQMLLPGQLQISGLHGNFFSQIHINKLHYQTGHQNISINNISLSNASFLKTLRHKLISHLHWQSAQIQLDTSNQLQLSPGDITLIGKFANYHAYLNTKLQTAKTKPQLIFLSGLGGWNTLHTFNLSLQPLAKNNKTHVIINKLSTPLAELTWDIQIPKLQQLLPRASGNIYSKGKIVETQHQPIVTGDLLATELHYANYQARRIQGLFRLESTSNGSRQIQITGQELQADKIHIEQVRLLAQGHSSSHIIKINATAMQQQLFIAAQGKFKDNSWHANINHIVISSEEFGIWHNTKTAAIAIKPQRIKLSAFCLNHHQSSICMQTTWQANTIDTTVKINDFQEFGLITELFPRIKNIKGQLNGQIKLQGTASIPSIKTALKLQGGEFSLPAANIHLRDIQFKLNNRGRHSLVYTATAKSGEGELNLQGNTNLATNNYHSKIELAGQNFTILNTPEYQAAINPKLDVIVSSSSLTIQGQLHIPQAYFQPIDLRSSASLSQDVIIIDQHAQANDSFPVKTNINVTLGDKIFINSFGLSGQLQGGIDINSQPDYSTTGTGELNIIGGKYQAYGQRLSINKGRLIFSGGSIDNPGLNIEAIKNITTASQISSRTFTSSEKHYVGIHVSGTLRQPKVSLFARPANLSQANILSYLVLGHALSNRTTNTHINLTQALSAVSLASGQTTSITDQIKHAFGLNELSVGEQSNYNPESHQVESGTAVTLGKAISSDLYLNYSRGILDPVNTFRARYRLNNTWSLQGESSSFGNGIDLLYSLNK